MKNHSQDVWTCDFLPVIDLFFRTVFVFFINELGSRRMVHFGVTRHATDAGVARQLREATPYGQAPRFLIRDNDCKSGSEFATVARTSGIGVWRTPHRAPRANAPCERFLGSVRRECLDDLLIMGEPQLYRVIKEDVPFFNVARPHQGIGQQIPEEVGSSVPGQSEGTLITFPIVNGLHHNYRRATGGPHAVISLG